MVPSLNVWLRAGVPQALCPSVHGAHSAWLLREVVAVLLHPPHARLSYPSLTPTSRCTLSL